jgi:F-type H+-transporting ATPase subunit epsilon
MELSIVTPDRSVVVGQASEVIIPGVGGEFDVLPGHAPKMSMLGTGVLSFTAAGKTMRLMVSGGFVEIDHDRVVLMCEQASLAGDVTTDTDKASVVGLEQQLKALGAVAPTDATYLGLKTELERASARLNLK